MQRENRQEQLRGARKKGDEEQRKLAITIKQTNSFSAFLFCLTIFAYTARDSNQETEKRIRGGVLTRRRVGERRRGGRERKRDDGRERETAVVRCWWNG
jgi:hypothetical protein